MASFRRYFDYEAHTVCGIPRVTLLGTADDWRDLRRRVSDMATYDLAWWVEALRPVCDKFVETAEGRPDPSFWKAIYKPRAVYGATLITGWIGRLFPYLVDHLGEAYRNTFALAPGSPNTSHTPS